MHSCRQHAPTTPTHRACVSALDPIPTLHLPLPLRCRANTRCVLAGWLSGHETTGSALTWTLYLLAQNPDKMAKAQVGVGASVRDCMHVHVLVFVRVRVHACA